jgi:hypothetical protein
MQEKCSGTLTVVLAGGLGNQLFQLAAGEYFSGVSGLSLRLECNLGNPRKLKNGLPEIFEYELGVDPTRIELEGFRKIRQVFWSKNLVANLDSDSRLSTSLKLRLLSTGFRLLTPEFENCYFSKDLGFENLIPKPNSLLSGYFQSYRYFSQVNVIEKLRRLAITEEHKEIRSAQELSKDENPLVVHIRRGDYRNEANFGLLNQSYYFDAIDYMLSRASYGRIWVFSDEIDLAQQLLLRRYGETIRWFNPDGISSAMELEKMRLGSGYIIANSSFSFWAAALSHNTKAMVVAPKPWFKDIPDPNFLIPPSWELMNARWE